MDGFRPEQASDEVSDVAEMLEVLTRRPYWHADAACKEAPREVTWFPEQRESAGPAKLVCRGCLVRAECMQWSLDQAADLAGVWGGLSKGQRAQLRQAKRAA